MKNDTITAISGVKVGHATNAEARTGCTVVLCEAGAVAGVDARGSAPGTRETDAIRPGRLVEKAHAVLLTGGSAFGLDAAGGVMRYLEARDVGYRVGSVHVPIVPAAVIYDLGVGDSSVRPDAGMGFTACENASEQPVEMGRIGAGTGATIGKGPGLQPSSGGVGSALVEGKSGLLVGAIVVVNAVGNVVDPRTGRILAGARDPLTGEFVAMEDRLRADVGANTTISVIASNAALSVAAANKVASMGHDGLARAIRPAHTMHDGDTLFALATGEVESDSNAVGILAAEAVAEAILRAVG